MASPRIQFRAIDNMTANLEARTSLSPNITPSQRESSLSETARRDLDRYYDMLRRSLPKFSLGEAKFLVDLLNGTINQPYSVSLLWAQASDAIEEGYAEKWEIDGPALVEKLRKLTPFECMAVADAIEQAWTSATYQVQNMEEKLRAIGLVKS